LQSYPARVLPKLSSKQDTPVKVVYTPVALEEYFNFYCLSSVHSESSEHLTNGVGVALFSSILLQYAPKPVVNLVTHVVMPFFAAVKPVVSAYLVLKT